MWEEILKMLGGSGGAGGMSGGSIMGMMSGSSGRGKLDTSASDHEMGLSMMTPYKDVSNAYSTPPGNSIGYLQALSNMQPQPQQKPQAQLDPYVQFLLSRFGGGRYG